MRLFSLTYLAGYPYYPKNTASEILQLFALLTMNMKNFAGDFQPILKFTHSFTHTPIFFVYRIYAEAKTGESILQEKVWNDFIKLDQLIQNVSIEHSGKWYKYSDLCSRWGPDCYENDILELGESMGAFQKGKLKFGYPAAFDPITYRVHSTGHFLTQVKLDESGTNVVSAKFILLNYFVVFNEKEDHLEK